MAADRRAATAFNVTGAVSSVLLVAFLALGERVAHTAWLWPFLAAVAVVVGLDVFLYTRAIAAWVASARRKDGAQRHPEEELDGARPRRWKAARREGPGVELDALPGGRVHRKQRNKGQRKLSVRR